MALAVDRDDWSGAGKLPLAGKASLAAEIMMTYAQVRTLLRRRTLPETVRALRTPSARGAPRVLPDGARHGARLGAAVVRVLAVLPVDSRCLIRSLVLLALLARRGVHSSLVIAVKPEIEDELAAHAWVEVDKKPLLAPAGADHGRLVAL